MLFNSSVGSDGLRGGVIGWLGGMSVVVSELAAVVSGRVVGAVVVMIASLVAFIGSVVDGSQYR